MENDLRPEGRLTNQGVELEMTGVTKTERKTLLVNYGSSITLYIENRFEETIHILKVFKCV